MRRVVHVGKPCMLAYVYMYRVCILAMEDVSCLLHKITNPYISLLRDSWSYNHTRTNCIPLVCLSALYAGCAANIYVHKYSILVEALERLQPHCDHTLEPLSAAGTQRTYIETWTMHLSKNAHNRRGSTCSSNGIQIQHHRYQVVKNTHFVCMVDVPLLLLLYEQRNHSCFYCLLKFCSNVSTGVL